MIADDKAKSSQQVAEHRFKAMDARRVEGFGFALDSTKVADALRALALRIECGEVVSTECVQAAITGHDDFTVERLSVSFAARVPS